MNFDFWVIEVLVDKGKFLFTEASYLIRKGKKESVGKLYKLQGNRSSTKQMTT